MPLFLSPVGVELQEAGVQHGAGRTVCCAGDGNPFCWRFGREEFRRHLINDFNAQWLSHGLTPCGYHTLQAIGRH